MLPAASSGFVRFHRHSVTMAASTSAPDSSSPTPEYDISNVKCSKPKSDASKDGLVAALVMLHRRSDRLGGQFVCHVEAKNWAQATMGLLSAYSLCRYGSIPIFLSRFAPKTSLVQWMS